MLNFPVCVVERLLLFHLIILTSLFICNVLKKVGKRQTVLKLMYRKQLPYQKWVTCRINGYWERWIASYERSLKAFPKIISVYIYDYKILNGVMPLYIGYAFITELNLFFFYPTNCFQVATYFCQPSNVLGNRGKRRKWCEVWKESK